MEPPTIPDTVKSILDGNRLGNSDLQEAVDLLQTYTLGQANELVKEEIFETSSDQ